MTRPKTGEQPFRPFADGAAVRTVGDLSFENGTDRIAVHGFLDIPRDAAGLALARALKATVDGVVSALEAADLPAEVAETPVPPKTVKNPFA